MIGMAGEDGRSAIELLGKHDAGEPVRQGHAPERQLEIGAGQHLRREPLGATDEKGEARGAGIAIFADGAGELGAAELFASRSRQTNLWDGGTLPSITMASAAVRAAAVGPRNSGTSITVTGARPSLLPAISVRPR